MGTIKSDRLASYHLQQMNMGVHKYLIKNEPLYLIVR